MLQEKVSKAVGAVLAHSFESLAHCHYAASLNLFYKYYFERALPNLLSYFFFISFVFGLSDMLTGGMTLYFLLLDYVRSPMPIAFLHVRLNYGIHYRYSAFL